MRGVNRVHLSQLLDSFDRPSQGARARFRPVDDRVYGSARSATSPHLSRDLLVGLDCDLKGEEGQFVTIWMR